MTTKDPKGQPMSEPCTSAAKISQLDERSRYHTEAIAGFRVALDKTNEILNKISQALSDIRHLHEDQQRNERDIDDLFRRVRVVEMAPGRTAGKAWWLIFGGLCSAVGGVTTALALMLLRSLIGVS